MKTGFQQQTSFIARLRIMLFVIAAFFVLGIMGLYLSSQGFLLGLQDIAHVNRILNLTGTTLQAMGTSQENLPKLESGVSPTRLAPLREASRIAAENLTQAITNTQIYPNVQSELNSALNSVKQFQSSVDAFAEKDFHDPENLKEEILVARELIVDVEENIGQAQLILKAQSDKIFNDIYANRFVPLMVAGFLSTAFFTFVVIVGFSNSRKLANSLLNLNKATDAVADGDLSYQAKILDSDEFGKLTHEFNHMVTSLHDKQTRLTEAVDKVTRLQSITNSFSGVLMPEQVYEVIVASVYAAIRTDAGSISLVSEDGKEIHNNLIGYHSAINTIPIDFQSPVADAVRTGESFFFENIQDMKDSYPLIHEILLKNNMSSTAYVPLISGNQIFGALNFGFKTRRNFDQDEKEFITALTRQCAQAIYRSKLFKSATDAIQIRDEFLSIASHELRTPLTPLKLQLQNMSRQVRKGQIHVKEEDVVLKIMDSSDKQVDRLINLIDDLLDVSRISAGKLTLHLEEFNFGEMTEDVIAHYSGQMTQAKTFLKLDIDKSINCRADRVRMEQVLINLLTNAVKYAPHKAVHVRVYRVTNKVHLEVEDEGQGISPENQKRIFDRFERVRDKNNIGGLGLGLYICRQIVEAHQGTISVDSIEGKGSKFTVEIPALS